MHHIRTILSIILGILFVFGFIVNLKAPSNDLNWNEDQAILPSVLFEDDIVHIDNIRDFSYTSATDYTANYISESYNVSDVTGVWFAVEPFQGFIGAAHTLVSFEFTNDRFLSVSIEIRKEQGESFSPFKGLMNQYEIMYVVATEEDVIDLRANHRQDDVYLYPVNTTPERAQAMFVSMMNKVHALETTPEFYNTVTNNCTSNLADHINDIVPGRLPWSYSFVLPEYSDTFALKHGLIAAEGNIDEVRAQFHINEQASEFAESEVFSNSIRN